MLVIYNPDGSIQQCILQAEQTLEVLAERYKEAGILHLMHRGDADILGCYVRDGLVVHRPEIEIAGAVRSIKADGVDSLHFDINPSAYTLSVVFEGKLIHRESSDTGSLDFSIEHPGAYRLIIECAFPYKTTIIDIEAIA